jgi:hypothetical protein
MANVLYPKFKEGLLIKQFDLLAEVVKVALVDMANAVYNPAHTYLSSVAAGIVARSPALAGKAITNGTFTADNTLIDDVFGPSVEALVLWIDRGADGANPLVGWIDTDPPIAYSPNGSDAEIRFNPAGIFAL